MKRSTIADLRHEIFAAREKTVAHFQAAQLNQGEHIAYSQDWYTLCDDVSQSAENVRIANNAVEYVLQLERALEHFNLLED